MDNDALMWRLDAYQPNILIKLGYAYQEKKVWKILE